MISSVVEEALDEGFLFIVLRLPNNPYHAQVSLWNNSDPKEYKIRIVDTDNDDINDVIRRMNQFFIINVPVITIRSIIITTISPT